MAATDNETTIARLNSLKVQIEKGKMEIAKAEANMETFSRQRDELVAQMAELGVTPLDIGDEIARLEKAIEEGLTMAEELIQKRG